MPVLFLSTETKKTFINKEILTLTNTKTEMKQDIELRI